MSDTAAAAAAEQNHHDHHHQHQGEELPPPLSPSDFVDEEAAMSSGPEVSDDEVLVPNTPPDRAPLCAQCVARDDVWAMVVRCFNETEVELDNYESGFVDSENELVRMMGRAELRDALPLAFVRAVDADVSGICSSLFALGHEYADYDWERREAERIRVCFQSMFATLRGLRKYQDAFKFYAKTLCDELGAINTSFMLMNLRPESRSLSDGELVFRARVALILMTNTSAIEPDDLRTFFQAEVPILRSAVFALVARLRREPSCQHNF
jgi:hypothetical protein